MQKLFATTAIALAVFTSATLFAAGARAQTPSPTPTAAVFPPPPQTFSGNLPVPSGIALVTWNGGELAGLVPEAERLGCRATSVWVTHNGEFVGYVFGAPALPNEAFVRLYPGAVVPAGAPLVVVCAVVTAPAPIDRAEVLPLAVDRFVGDPPRLEGSVAYLAYITSGLPGGCVRFQGHELRREGDTFVITVLNRVPPPGAQIPCTAIYGTVDFQVHLGERGRELEPGRTYTVRVNDVTRTFTVQ